MFTYVMFTRELDTRKAKIIVYREFQENPGRGRGKEQIAYQIVLKFTLNYTSNVKRNPLLASSGFFATS